MLDAIFKRSDEFLLALEPTIRPGCIVVPQARNQELSYNHDEWLGDIEQAASHFVNRLNTEQEVIGELTTWVWMDWDMPTETRMSTVCHPQWNNDSDIETPSTFFPSSIHWSANDYPNISFIDSSSLVIYGCSSYIDHGGIEWLALNPQIAISLGWYPSGKGAFQWVNKKGNVMVESLYWKDGPISRLPPKMDDICSNGWLVVASHEAIDKIRRAYGEAIKLNGVIRSYKSDTYTPNKVTYQQRFNW